MKSLRLLLPLSLIAAMAACGGKGKSASAPTNFQIEAQDSQLHMTWNAEPGVEYWVFCAPNASSIDSHSSVSSHSGWLYYTGIFSGDFYATGLSNGTPYACTVNGRYDKGPGGPDAQPISAAVNTPRPAGEKWISGANAMNGITVRSVAYGLLSAQSTSTDQFVAVGDGGQIAVSTAVASDAQLTWGTPARAAGDSVSSTFNAVTYYPNTSGYRFVAVGNGGQVAYSTNTAAWTAGTMNNGGKNMHAVAAAAGSSLVAVGDGGYIATSTDGVSWTGSSTGSSTLRSVAYAPSANGASTSPYWITVGDNGAVFKSVDSGSTWADKSPTGLGAQNLKGVAILPVTNSASNVTSYILAAVGDSGIWVSTNDGDSWQAVGGVSGVFQSVHAAKGQFMALTASGQVYTSADGSTWINFYSGLNPASVVLRYTPSVGAVSNGWMVFNASGQQRIAR